MALATIPTVPGVRPIVELGVGSLWESSTVGMWQDDTAGGGQTVQSRWQPAPLPDTDAATSEWVGDEPLWHDVTCYVREVSTFTGRERAVEAWEVGTASIIVDNPDGWADYPPQPGASELLSVRPGRPIRVGVSTDDTALEPVLLWSGFIDAMTPVYDPTEGAQVTFDCIDAKGEVGRVEIGSLDGAVGAHETADDRIRRILTAANWPLYRRDIDDTGIQLRATSLGGQAVDLLDIAADSAGGVVFGNLDGDLAFRNRDWEVFGGDDPIWGTISNTGNGICPSLWELSFSREDISTRVLLSRPDDVTPIQRDDIDGRALMGVETFIRDDLETDTNSELAQLADRLINVRSYRWMPRVAAVTLDAATDPAVVGLILAATPYQPTRLLCFHQGADGRMIIDGRTMLVVGTEHVISPEGWTCRVALDDADPYTVLSTTRWSDGVEDYGRWYDTEDPLAGHWVRPV